MKQKEWYRRNLPHIQPLDGIFNICFRLHGSLPIKKIKEIQEERDRQLKELEKSFPELPPEEIRNIKCRFYDKYFAKFDQLLDDAYSGPTYLKEPAIAEIVKNGLHYWDGKRLRLICYCIMPNHVHLIIDSCQDQLFILLKSIKTYTARKSNQALNRTGYSFWHKESYDNLIGSPRVLAIKAKYILNNPVKAGLVKSWESWPHTYLNPEFTWIL